MKKISLIILGTMALISSCQRNSHDQIFVSEDYNVDNALFTETYSTSEKKEGACNSSIYNIVLESRTLVNGYWEWVWSIQNTNPGNGSNGTAQDLSNWGMQLGACVNFSSVVGAAYSSDGINWTSFTPSYEPNTSQDCMTTPVVKFDFGTTGSAKTYYRLVIDQDVAQGFVAGYYKSGGSCCTFNFTGLGCGGPVEIVE